MSRKKLLIVQFGAFGDCLFTTAALRNLRSGAYEDWKIYWLIGSKYQSVLCCNEFVDEVLVYDINTSDQLQAARERADEIIRKYDLIYKFDKIIKTDYVESNFDNWWGTTRASIMRSAGLDSSKSPEPYIVLSSDEVSRVDILFKENRLNDSDCFKVFVECAPQSGQSVFNFELGLSLAKQLVSNYNELLVFISTPNHFVSGHDRIIDASFLSFRENAELIRRADLIVGCSSGLSWLAVSNWTKRKNIIQFIDYNYMNKRLSASMLMDFDYFGLDSSNIIEFSAYSQDLAEEVLYVVINSGFAEARSRYHNYSNIYLKNNKYILTMNASPSFKLKLLCDKYIMDILYSKFYRVIKPKWFKPVFWIKRFLSKNKQS